MILAVPHKETKGCEKFKEFLHTPFTLNMLDLVLTQNTSNKLFYGWHGKDMGNWYKFTNDDDKIVLEFYPTYYTIQKKDKNSIPYMMSIPLTIDDFIFDMNRVGIPLYWSEWIDLNFEPTQYLPVGCIKEYFVGLLTKMDKSHELL